MLLDYKEETIAYCYLTKTELRQIYRRFRHPSIRRLTKVLEQAGYNDIGYMIIEHLTKFYKHC